MEVSGNPDLNKCHHMKTGSVQAPTAVDKWLEPWLGLLHPGRFKGSLKGPQFPGDGAIKQNSGMPQFAVIMLPAKEQAVF